MLTESVYCTCTWGKLDICHTDIYYLITFLTKSLKPSFLTVFHTESRVCQKSSV